VSFEIPQGQAFCLLGRSGTGKSVALRHIIGLVKADSGCVFVEDSDITTLGGRRLADVRKHMGVLFQNAALFDSMSVGDNVAFPMRRHTDWSGAEFASARWRPRTSASKRISTMPGDLSGGMKKRAGLARASARPSDPAGGRPSAGLIDDLTRSTSCSSRRSRVGLRSSWSPQHSERACDR
jgi:phospholipid/cholesterol/gamma-HCH transport system ATP-binding protein